MTPRALHIMNESSGPARVFVEALEERGFEIVTVSPHAGQLPDSPEGFAAILSGGGTADTHQTDEHPWLIHEVALLRAAIAAGVPTMGLCLGAQLLTEAAGGTVYRCEPPEVGWYEAPPAESLKNVSCVRSPPGNLTRWTCVVSANRVEISISRFVGCQLDSDALRASV